MTAGRPTKYSKALERAIVQAVAAGSPETYAATAAGIDRSTLTEWKKRKPAFSSAIKRARAQAIKRRIERIEQAAKGGRHLVEVTETFDGGKLIKRIKTTKHAPPAWQADAWYLERQFCEEFGLNRLDLKELLHLLSQAKKKGTP